MPVKEQDENLPLVKNTVPATETKRKPEIRKESQEQQAVLAGMLIKGANELAAEAHERRTRRKQEVIELHSGVKITLAEIEATVTANRQPYVAFFPNDAPFFAGLSRLSGLNFDPKEFVKPPIVHTWLVELTYNRYPHPKEVLAAVRALNPALTDGHRRYKHSQFLTTEARAKLIQYRDEAIAVMNTCSSMPEFRQKMLQEYGVPFQTEMFGQ